MDLTDWTPLNYTPPKRLAGHGAVLDRLDPARHAADLFAANGADAQMWRFMPYGPFPDLAAYRGWAEGAARTDDPAFYAIGDGMALRGVASLMRIEPRDGVIEIGHIALSPSLRRTRPATAALHLMIDQAFAAGFRRVEWKCDARNAASRRAALRLGFQHEGIFRQHMIVKGQNRDTAWFAILDGAWPAIRAAHLAWLSPENFDETGQQRQALTIPVAPSLAPTDP